MNSERMIQYLLGELSTEEQVEMETEYFSDPEKFNLLQTIENDLIEGYVNGKLNNNVRARFEAHYMSIASRRKQVQFFQTLVKAIPMVNEQPLPATAREVVGSNASWWQSLSTYFGGIKLSHGLSYAAAILIIIAGVTWQVREMMRLREQLSQSESQRIALQERARQLDELIAQQREDNKKLLEERKGIQNQINTLPSPGPDTATVASLTWTLPGNRSVKLTQTQKLRIKPNIASVRLNFNLPVRGYNPYGLSLQTLAGQEVWKRSDIRSNRGKAGEIIVVTVPAKEFRNGTYIVVLSGNNSRGERVEVGQFYIEAEPGS
jgi:hypothetical protein